MLGVAQGLPLSDIKRFLGSLFFALKDSKQPLYVILFVNEADVQRFERTADVLIRRVGQQALFRVRCLRLEMPAGYHRLWVWKRMFLLTLDWLGLTGTLGDNDHVMLSDTRDVLVQGDI